MRTTLILTLQVTYEVDNENDLNELEDNLLEIASRASGEGWLTQDTDALVVVAVPSVERLL